MNHLMYYMEFEIFEDTPYEGVTNFPITLKYHDETVDQYRSLEEAKREIDSRPEWLERLIERVNRSN